MPQLTSIATDAAQSRAAWADEPTLLMPAVARRVPTTEPGLPLQDQDRPYVEIVDADASIETFLLVEEAVRRYYDVQKCYPAVVLLSAFRFLTRGRVPRYYYPRDFSQRGIPYAYEEGGGYDVRVR